MKYQHRIPLSRVRIAAFVACLAATGSAAQAVQWGNMQANSILFLGNSITMHAPEADLTPVWTGNWGMAASSQAHDYVHALAGEIDAKTGGALSVVPTAPNIPAWSPGDPLPDIAGANVVNICDAFERNYSTWDNVRLRSRSLRSRISSSCSLART